MTGLFETLFRTNMMFLPHNRSARSWHPEASGIVTSKYVSVEMSSEYGDEMKTRKLLLQEWDTVVIVSTSGSKSHPAGTRQ